MPADLQGPPLLACNPVAIPAELQVLDRWSVWDAVWRPKKGKYDKIPKQVRNPLYGISTANLDQWGPFDKAVTCYENYPHLGGLGVVLTGGEAYTAIDLDRCYNDGVLAPWAHDLVTKLGTYTEISPSGHGIRLFLRGHIDRDWTNNDQGIEVYSGNTGRFVTVTGQPLGGTPLPIVELNEDVMSELEAMYATERQKASVLDIGMPNLIDDVLDLPELSELNLDYRTREWLEEGKTKTDRSDTLHRAGIALYAAGLTDAQVFTLMVNNPHCLETALDHRHQDMERAMQYLWVEQCVKAKPKGVSRIVSADDFEVLEDESPQPPAQPVAVSGTPMLTLSQAIRATASPKRFRVKTVAEFMQGKALTWFFKKWMPRAGLGLVYGASGSGKSFLVAELAIAIQTGGDWMGMRCRHQGNVVYICAEGASGFRQRLKAWAEYHGRDPGIGIIDDIPNLMEAKDIKDLLEALKDIPNLEMVVVDTFAQTTPGANENSGEDMGRALAHCRTINQVTGAMVQIISHTGKDATRGVRGWSGLRAAVDVEIEVEKFERDDGNIHKATVTKMKDGEEGQKLAFKLTGVLLGQDEDGEDIKAAVVVGSDLPSMPGPETKLRDTPKVVYDAVKALGFDGEPVPLTAVYLQCKEVMGELLDARGYDRNKEKVSAALKSQTLKELFDISATHISLR